MIGRVKPLKELAERLLNECATIDTPLFGHSDFQSVRPEPLRSM